MREYNSRPANRDRKNKRQRERYAQDPDFRKLQLAKQKTPEARRRARELATLPKAKEHKREYFSQPEVRKHRAEVAKRWQARRRYKAAAALNMVKELGLSIPPMEDVT
jgi:hypothetical protein